MTFLYRTLYILSARVCSLHTCMTMYARTPYRTVVGKLYARFMVACET